MPIRHPPRANGIVTRLRFPFLLKRHSSKFVLMCMLRGKFFRLIYWIYIDLHELLFVTMQRLKDLSTYGSTCSLSCVFWKLAFLSTFVDGGVKLQSAPKYFQEKPYSGLKKRGHFPFADCWLFYLVLSLLTSNRDLDGQAETHKMEALSVPVSPAKTSKKNREKMSCGLFQMHSFCIVFSSALN